MYSSADGKEIFGVDNNGCLVLSNPFNNQQLKLTSEGLELVLANENASDTKVAYFSTNEFRIRDGVIEKSLRLGSYIFNPRSNGNLSLEWRE